jgi:glucokinase
VWRIKSGDRSDVADQVKGDFSKIAAADVLQGARKGDGVSISVVRDTAKYVGMAVANLATMFDPEIVVLGGIIASSGDIMLEPIRAETSRRLLPQQAEQVRVELSTLGDDAIAIGAARAVA